MSSRDPSPLVVVNALVIRADSTPGAGVRSSRGKYNANRAGAGIEDAGIADRTLAIEARPQFEWEAFDEYWRKTHGSKIVHREGPDDRVTPLLVYYLQQHRLPSGPNAEYPPPYPAKIGADGLLVPDPAARAVPYVRPDWDGLAQLAFLTREHAARFFDPGPGKYGDKIVPDEAVFLRGYAFHLAEEHVMIQNGDGRRDPIILIKTHRRNDDLASDGFRDRWFGEHAALVRSLPQAARLIRRYAQLHNVSERGDVLYDPVGGGIDGITVMSFANLNDVEDFVSSEEYARVAADEQLFAAATKYFTAINYVILDKTA